MMRADDQTNTLIIREMMNEYFDCDGVIRDQRDGRNGVRDDRWSEEWEGMG